MEIPIAMVLLSRILDERSNRWANVVAGSVMTAVQLASLFAYTPAPYYVFFSAFEIGATAAIVWLAWRWRGLGARDIAPAASLDPVHQPLIVRTTFPVFCCVSTYFVASTTFSSGYTESITGRYSLLSASSFRKRTSPFE